jgi:hypothetical protein
LQVAKRNDEAQPDQAGHGDDGQGGPDSAGQSGDTQGLSQVVDAADQSVEGLADSGQDYEAEVVAGVEDAADHPERSVHTHEDRARPTRIAPEME